MKKIYTICLWLIFIFTAKAQTTHFQQNFSAGGTPASYTATSPNNTQFNALAGLNPVITNNAVQFTRPTDSGTGYMHRSANFAGPPTSLHVQFTFEVVSHDPAIAGTSAVIFYVGTNFSAYQGPQNPDVADTYARLGFNLPNTTSGQFQLRASPQGGGNGGTNSAAFSGRQTITFAMNNTGSNNFNYVSPTGSLEALPNDTYDVWVGNTKVFNDLPVLVPTQQIANFKFRMSNGVGVVQIGNILMRDIAQALPVELLSFTAKPQGQQVQLAWATTSERNADRFEVQRSHDLSEFLTLGEVRAKGNTDLRQYYGLVDERPLDQSNYYRLKQVDQDGRAHYSKVVSVVMDNLTPAFEILGNPTDGHSIYAAVRNLAGATYRLTTLAGRDLSMTNQIQTDGSVVLTPAHPLSSGMYLLEASTGSKRLVQKVVIR